MDSTREKENRKICLWCCRYFRAGSDCCSESCRELRAKYGMNRIELQLKYDIFRITGRTFRKNCRWCFGFFSTEDATEDFCSSEHEELFVSHGEKSLAQVRISDYLDKCDSSRIERRRTKGFIEQRCTWCGIKFKGAPNDPFCETYHRELFDRFGGTQTEFFKNYDIIEIIDRKFKKSCAYCKSEFLTDDPEQVCCSNACSKMLETSGGLSKEFYELKLRAFEDLRRERGWNEKIKESILSGDGSAWKAQVEWVLSLPPESRYAFTKDWKEKERRYAKSLTHSVSAIKKDKELKSGDIAELAGGLEDIML